MKVNENPGGKVQLFATVRCGCAYRRGLKCCKLKRRERHASRLKDLFASDLFEEPGPREIPIII